LRVLNWAGFKAAATYTFDDANSSQIQHYAELQALGVPFTFFLWTSKSEAANPIWARAVLDGHELGNHTKSHATNGTDADVDAASAFITERFGINVWTMASPYGNASYVPLAQSRFLANRGVNSGYILPNGSSDPFQFPCHIPQQGALASAFNSVLDSARNAGAWQIVLVHGFTGGTDGAYQAVSINEFTASVTHTKSWGDVWIGTMVDVAAYWRAQKMFSALTPTISDTERTWTWTLPAHFPPGKCLRVSVDGGTLKQGGAPLAWNEHGYYDVALDQGSLTLSSVVEPANAGGAGNTASGNTAAGASPVGGRDGGSGGTVGLGGGTAGSGGNVSFGGSENGSGGTVSLGGSHDGSGGYVAFGGNDQAAGGTVSTGGSATGSGGSASFGGNDSGSGGAVSMGGSDAGGAGGAVSMGGSDAGDAGGAVSMGGSDVGDAGGAVSMGGSDASSSEALGGSDVGAGGARTFGGSDNGSGGSGSFGGSDTLGGSGGVPDIGATGVIKLSVPLSADGQVQGFDLYHSSPPLDLSGATVSARVYAPDALNADLVLWLSSRDGGATEAVITALTELNTGYVTIEATVPAADGLFDSRHVDLVHLEIRSNSSGPWQTPATIVYLDSFTSSNGELFDTFDVSPDPSLFVPSEWQTVENASFEWLSRYP
jgi:hypothetical protein